MTQWWIDQSIAITFLYPNRCSHYVATTIFLLLLRQKLQRVVGYRFNTVGRQPCSRIFTFTDTRRAEFKGKQL